MCVATVGLVVEIQGQRALVDFSGALKEVSIALLPQVKIDDHVMVHAGFAAEIVQDVSKLYREMVASDARAGQILDAIRERAKKFSDRQIRIMNFCGSHEHTTVQYGLRELLPANIELLSGPGCPVCVTAAEEIALGMEAVWKNDVTLTTFGDLVRVPTPWGSLAELRASGGDVRVVSDVQQALRLARTGKKEVVHLAVGFETTAPATAAAVVEAAAEVPSFSIISAHRVTPPAMRYILANHAVEGVLCPGHVAMITGLGPFHAIFADFSKPYVICGFTPLDVLQGILLLLQQLAGLPVTRNQYASAVREEGNTVARNLMNEVFSLTDAYWRHIDVLPASRLVLCEKYQYFDAEYRFALQVPPVGKEKGRHCLCENILQGENPRKCPHFATGCTPEQPLGPCMVSREGACLICYNKGRS